MTYLYAAPAGPVEPPYCCICGKPGYLTDERYSNRPICQPCRNHIDAYDRKQEERIERIKNRAVAKRQEFEALSGEARKMASVIPFGQPILVGHHSEKRDRNYRKRIDRKQHKAYETMKESERLDRRAVSAERNRAVSSDDPGAILKLSEKIEKAQDLQRLMVAANKAIRKHKKVGQPPQVAALVELGFSEEHAFKLLKPDFLDRVGFPSYALSNNSANIRRMKSRIADLRTKNTRDEAQAEEIQHETEPIPGVKITEDRDDNRIRLHFPGKPKSDVRTLLKQNGWRWSPSNTAWQRQLTPNARSNAGYIISRIREIGL